MPLPHSLLDWALIQRLTGRASPQDDQAVGDWTASDSAHARFLEQLEQAWERTDEGLSPRDEAWRMRAWKKVATRMEASTHESDALVKGKTSAHNPSGILGRLVKGKSIGGGSVEEVGAQTLRLGVARLGTRTQYRSIWYKLSGLAAAALLLAVGWSVNTYHLGRTPMPASTYTTARGERANITLPDGNTVALDVDSRLDVPANYLQGNHLVHLVGAALFTVSHHSTTPFTVAAGNTIVRVLGTSFMVRHYATDSSAIVAVREGRVSVLSVVVAQNQLLEVTKGGAMHVGVADPSHFTFATGVLTLRRTSLANAIPELDRWYNADIRLGDVSLERQEINGSMNAGSLSDLSMILEGALNVRVVRDGRILTLFAR